MSFLNHLNRFEILLASGSPRRQELLERLGVKFTLLLKNDLSEEIPENLPFEHAASYLARKKSDAYFEDLTNGQILITADTIVTLDQVVLNKPNHRQEAIEMLTKLNNREHTVITGVCLRSMDKISCFEVATEVWFAQLDVDEITHYIDSCQPFDKAGSYGIQEWIGCMGVRSISGSYFNVMGLPTHQLYNQLKTFTEYQPKA